MNRLAQALAVGIILTATFLLVASLGEHSPATNYDHGREQRVPNARQANAANNQHAAVTRDRPPIATGQPSDPEEHLRQIQALNDYNRRLTQPNNPAMPTDPARPYDPTTHTDPTYAPPMPNMPIYAHQP